MGYYYKLGDDYVNIKPQNADILDDLVGKYQIHPNLKTTMDKSNYFYSDIFYNFFKYNVYGFNYVYDSDSGSYVWFTNSRELNKGTTTVGGKTIPIDHYYVDNKLFITKDNFYLPLPKIQDIVNQTWGNQTDSFFYVSKGVHQTDITRTIIIESQNNDNNDIRIFIDDKYYDAKNPCYIIMQAAGGNGGNAEKYDGFTDLDSGSGGGSGAYCVFFGSVLYGHPIKIVLTNDIIVSTNNTNICECYQGGQGKKGGSGGLGGEIKKYSNVKYTECIIQYGNGALGGDGKSSDYSPVDRHGEDQISTIPLPMYLGPNNKNTTPITREGGKCRNDDRKFLYMDYYAGGGGAASYLANGATPYANSFLGSNLKIGSRQPSGNYGSGGAGGSSGSYYNSQAGETWTDYYVYQGGYGGDSCVLIWTGRKE